MSGLTERTDKGCTGLDRAPCDGGVYLWLAQRRAWWKVCRQNRCTSGREDGLDSAIKALFVKAAEWMVQH
ncbi:hypothetical protein scyTo_0009052 [Scyliorhinus torazame]|uniref:Uncharacterized protein n=1 Tax=Scyliorhinus torazame TaxID=75743 RepID=A0A401PGD2_SCYTO|nr:hypothetical protein [Scyliorhinus torazame]